MGKSLSSNNGNDKVMTPLYVCKQIVEHFNPSGKILEPCCGTGNFLQVLPNSDWFEIDKGKDFMSANGYWDWIITNPPYSKYKDFLSKAMDVADNIIFLIPIVHIWTKARLKIMNDKGFSIKEIYCITTPPPPFPQMGFQFGCVYYKKRWKGKANIIYGTRGGRKKKIEVVESNAI